MGKQVSHGFWEVVKDESMVELANLNQSSKMNTLLHTFGVYAGEISCIIGCLIDLSDLPCFRNPNESGDK